eukprot:1394783-Karenia_brevis.AAC.1
MHALTISKRDIRKACIRKLTIEERLGMVQGLSLFMSSSRYAPNAMPTLDQGDLIFIWFPILI